MNLVEKKKSDGDLNERLTTGVFRFTPQRQQVYDVLIQKRDHPTAEEVFIRAKQAMPDISMATVYNCLDALVQCGLVRQVQLERGATRLPLPRHPRPPSRPPPCRPVPKPTSARSAANRAPLRPPSLELPRSISSS